MILLLDILSIVKTQPNNQRVLNPPGFPSLQFQVFSGYLQTRSKNKSLHYLFYTSASQNQNDPIVLWLNGGPGCSSLFGAFKQIGPYIINNTFKDGDKLIYNKHGWNRKAHILFIQSPAGVGFSIDNNDNYTDQITAQDNIAALNDFFLKFAKYRLNNFFIAGQSYAGKYIPDLAVQIITNSPTIRLKGILVGNGVFNFQGDSLRKSQIQYLIQHNLIQLEYKEMYQTSCRQDWDSPRCRFLLDWQSILRKSFDVYNIFHVCKNTQAAQLMKMLNKKQDQILQAIPQCPSSKGLTDYLNMYRTQFNIKIQSREWSQCNNINYKIDQQGSITSYLTIMDKIRILIYSGDFDDQVPLIDTLKNLRQKLHISPVSQYKPWFHDNQHSGFVQLYHQNVTLAVIKAAGHMVPQDKRGPAYQMFQNFIYDRPINNQVD